MTRTYRATSGWRGRIAPSCQRIVLSAAVAALLLATPARADSDGPEFFRVVGVRAGDVLNIRSGAGADHPKVGEIPAGGNGIRNHGCQGGLNIVEWEKASPAEREAGARRRWCQVEYRGIKGWAAGRFLAEGSGPK